MKSKINHRLIGLASIVAFSAIALGSWRAAMGQERGQTVRPASGKRVALVIGNSTYANAPLANPANDARDMARALREFGFDVTELINQNRREMRAAIRSFGEKLKSGGAGLFYYAGHGMQVDGKNYLIPIGADPVIEAEIEDDGVDLGLVLKHMAEAGNRPNIIILDACRNNPFARSFRSSSRGLAVVDAPGGMIIAYATAPGRVASDGPARNGLYTAELLKQMRAPNQDIKDVFMRVTAAVEAKTNRAQVPWQSSSITEPFYFAGSQDAGRVRIKGGGSARPPQKPTPTPTPTPTPRPQARKQKVESHFFVFELDQCRISGSMVNCNLTVTNTDDDRPMEIQGNSHSINDAGTHIYDNSNKFTPVAEASLASPGNRRLTLIRGNSVSLKLSFKDATPGATKITRLTVQCLLPILNNTQIFQVHFRDICLTPDC